MMNTMNLNRSVIASISLRTYIKSRYKDDWWWMIPNSESYGNIKTVDHFEAWVEWLYTKEKGSEWSDSTPDEWFCKLID